MLGTGTMIAGAPEPASCNLSPYRELAPCTPSERCKRGLWIAPRVHAFVFAT